MIQAGITADREEGVDGAGLGIGAAVDDTGHARVDEGAGAHGAGLQRHVDGRAFEAPVAERGGGAAEGVDLGVGGGILIGLAAVAAAADDGAGGVHHDGAHGDVAHLGGGLGLAEGFAHETRVGGICDLGVHRLCLRLHAAGIQRPAAGRLPLAPRREIGCHDGR